MLIKHPGDLFKCDYDFHKLFHSGHVWIFLGYLTWAVNEMAQFHPLSPGIQNSQSPDQSHKKLTLKQSFQQRYYSNLALNQVSDNEADDAGIANAHFNAPYKRGGTYRTPGNEFDSPTNTNVALYMNSDTLRPSHAPTYAPYKRSGTLHAPASALSTNMAPVNPTVQRAFRDLQDDVPPVTTEYSHPYSQTKDGPIRLIDPFMNPELRGVRTGSKSVQTDYASHATSSRTDYAQYTAAPDLQDSSVRVEHDENENYQEMVVPEHGNITVSTVHCRHSYL